MSHPRVSYSTVPKLDQVLILGLCRAIEPVAFASIGPYLYFMIRDFGYDSPATIVSLCTFAAVGFGLGQMTSSLLWVQIADRYGRKPSLLVGLIGSLASTVFFGFSTNVYMAMSARFMGGILNGCVMLARTMAGEIVAHKRKYKNHVFSILVVGSSLGYTFGPLFTGFLANPVDRYPDVFGNLEIFKRFPYLLPNLLPVPAYVFVIITVLLFVEETGSSLSHALLSKEGDPMIKLGNVIKKWFKDTDRAHVHEYEPITNLDDVEYGTASVARTATNPASDTSWRLKEALSKPVIVTIVCNLLNFSHCTFYLQLLPLFFATPRDTPSPSLPNPIMFGGGLEMNSREIGVIMCVIGLVAFVLQITLYPLVSVRKGNIIAYRVGLVGFLAYIFVPYLAIVPSGNIQLLITLISILGCSMSLGSSFTFPTLDVLTTNAAPPHLLNTVNGMVQVGQALGRVVGPVLFGNLFALGVDMGMVGLAWWVMAGVVAAQLAVSRML